MNFEKLELAVKEIKVRPYLSRFFDRVGPNRRTLHRLRNSVAVLGVLAAILLLTSCATTNQFEPTIVNYRDEAGGVLLSVNSVGRWEQVADAMQPKFNLASGDAALSKVMPTTARIQQQILDAFGLSLGLGLPQSFSESAAARTATESQTNTGATSSQGFTNTATSTSKPGVVPSAPSGKAASGEFPSGIAPGTDLGFDPLLQYRAAASLYQTVQLMNREVELAVKRKGFVPYIVRMQLVNIPYRRHLPYDVYAQVAFFPASKTLPFSSVDDNTQLPYVVPLIVTDDLEQAIKSRAAEVARQLGLAVSAMVQGVGGNVGANWEKRNRESVLAADVNSLLTVGRLNDNGIFIRLGAANEATGGNALVGRTYDISLLLLVPEDYFNAKPTAGTGEIGSDSSPLKYHFNQQKDLTLDSRAPISQTEASSDDASQSPVTLSIITHTDLRNALSGELLKERRDVTLLQQVDRAFERILSPGYQEMYEAWLQTKQDRKLNIAKKLITPIQTSDYKKFYDETKSIILKPSDPAISAQTMLNKDKCLETKSDQNSPKKCICNEKSDEFKDYRLACISAGYLRSLWGYLASTMIESSTKSASVELPMPPDIIIPKQTALMRDDGKEKIDIVLHNVSGITATGILAKIVLVSSDGNTYEFPSEAISPATVTGTLVLQFPSPAKWNLGKIDYGKSSLIVERRPCALGRACATATIESPFAVLHAAVPSDKPKPGFDLRASTNEIVVDKGAGTVKLVFDNFKDDSAVLTWSGAEVKSAKNADSASVDIALDKITVKSKTVLTLEIQNAKPDGKVSFKAVGSKNDKITGEVTKEFAIVAGK